MWALSPAAAQPAKPERSSLQVYLIPALPKSCVMCWPCVSRTVSARKVKPVFQMCQSLHKCLLKSICYSFFDIIGLHVSPLTLHVPQHLCLQQTLGAIPEVSKNAISCLLVFPNWYLWLSCLDSVRRAVPTNSLCLKWRNTKNSCSPQKERKNKSGFGFSSLLCSVL